MNEASLTAFFEEAHAEMMERGADCRACPLFKRAIKEHCGAGPVPSELRPGKSLVVIGEAPGPAEVEDGVPFVGASGKVLNGQLQAAGLSRENGDFSVINTIACRPPDEFEAYEDKLRAVAKKSGETPRLPSECCRPRFERDLKEANAKVEYAVGRMALAGLARYYDVPYGKERKKTSDDDFSIAHLRKQHGAPIVVREPSHPEGAKVIIASYHPAFALRGAKDWMPIIKKVMRRAGAIAARGGTINWDKPRYILDPTLDQVEAFAEEAVDTKRKVMVDIETGPGLLQHCPLRTVGWGFRRDNGDEVIMVVPYRDMEGNKVWREAQYARVDKAIRHVMNNAALAGQNFSFDSGVLLRLGLMTKRQKRWIDVMLAHHDTDSCTLPHDLGFIVSEYFEAPHHKHDVDHKSVDNVDYDKLKAYNADDVLTQLRCMEQVMLRVKELGTVPQFIVDTKLAPHCRDAGELGLVIDETERMRLAEVLLERVEYFRALFRFEVACLFAPASRVKEARTKLAKLREAKDPDHTPAWFARQFQCFAAEFARGELNPNSPNQLRDLLFVELDLTPPLNTDGYDFDEEAEDDPSTGQAAILKLIEKDASIEPMCEALLEYRAYNKLYGTYVADRKGRIQDVDWTKWGMPANALKRILHTVYKIHVIPSGRLSTQPAIQNWPAVGKANMRTMVVAPDGHCIVGADYDQLELRIYAIEANDQLLLQAFSEKDKFGKPIDPHALNAAALLADTDAAVWDKYYEIAYEMPPKKKKYWRTVAKRFCYLETYGGEEEKLFSTMAASRNKGTGKRDFPNLRPEEVTVWHERWHKLHPETKRWQRARQRAAYRNGFVRVQTLDERARFWPGGIDKKNAPPNHTIQGFAAAIANRGMLNLVEAIPHRAWSPVSGVNLQVHDYIGAYVPLHRAWEAKHLVEEALQYEYKGMKFTCTADVSYRWSDQG